MAGNNVKHLWGAEFSVVPEGLSEGQVVSFVNDLIARSQGNGAEAERHSSMVQLAEKTILEAHKLAESIKERATRDAEAEAERINKLAHKGPRADRQSPGIRPTRGRDQRECRGRSSRESGATGHEEGPSRGARHPPGGQTAGRRRRLRSPARSGVHRPKAHVQGQRRAEGGRRDDLELDSAGPRRRAL